MIRKNLLKLQQKLDTVEMSILYKVNKYKNLNVRKYFNKTESVTLESESILG